MSFAVAAHYRQQAVPVLTLDGLRSLRTLPGSSLRHAQPGAIRLLCLSGPARYIRESITEHL
jgi:hypothetical protein